MGEKTNDSGMLQDLRVRVEKWTRLHKQKQSTLAAECGVNAADLTHFLSGQRSLPIYAVANLALELDIDPARLLLDWEISQWKRKLYEDSSARDPSSTQAKTLGWERATKAFEFLLKRLPSGEPAQVSSGPGTLRDWPSAFLPLVVFVGDRRETPPQSPADLLAASASMGDLYYFPKLQLPPETEIRSDKTGVIASPESLRSLVQDKNLLIIGSPAANLMARVVNSGACFSFHVTSEASARAEEFQRILEPIRYLPGELERYAGGENSITPIEKEWSRLRRYMIYGFARSGILDPVDYGGLRATSITAHSDYGLVSLCRHPWSEKHVAIMAAGLHGPATAAAVKLLSQENAFIDRPLGGVFRVHVPINAPWEERYQHLNPGWDTHTYSIEKYAAAVKDFADKYQKELEAQFKFWNPKDVEVLLNLVGSHVEARVSPAITQEGKMDENGSLRDG